MNYSKKQGKKLDFSYQNICIPIKLYNKHIPSEKIDLDCEYLMFGHYDGITVDTNIFEEKPEFLDIWRHSLESVDLSGLKRNFSQEIIYAMRHDEKGWRRDFEFWENMELPFLFLCVMQLECTHNFVECKKFIEQRIKDRFTELHKAKGDKLDVICYFSFENNSLIVALKCNKYDVGIDVINSMHQENAAIQYSEEKSAVPIKYTYTLNGIATSVLKNGAYKNITEEIEEVHLYAIEKKPGSIKQISKVLEEKLNRKDEKNVESRLIAGNDDECIIIKNVKWCDLLYLYANNEDSVLTGGNKIFCKETYSIATHFLCGISKSDYFLDSHPTHKENAGALGYSRDSICQDIGVHLKAIFEMSKDSDRMAVSSRRMTYYKAMSQILNSLQKFEIAHDDESAFNDYTYFMLYRPLKMLALVIRFAAVLENSGYEMDYYLSSKEVFSFLNGVTLIAQNSLHSNRQFTQAPDFNAVVYETPVKLNAFYGAFVDKIRNMLNVDSATEYEFLIVPGLNEYMMVRDIFDRLIEKKRLFILEIPERQIFEPGNLMPALVHEIAHKVGSAIRARDNRDKQMQAWVVYAVTFDIFQFIGIHYIAKNVRMKKIYDKIRAQFLVELENVRKENKEGYQAMKEEYNEVIAKHFGEGEYSFADLQIYLSDVVYVDFVEAVAETLKKLMKDDDFIDGLWNSYCESHSIQHDTSFYYFNEHIVSAINLFMFAQKYRDIVRVKEINPFAATYVPGFRYGLQPEVEDMIFIFRETYADIINIITLDLGFDAYLDTIIHHNLHLDIDNICKSIMIIRFTLVYEFMTQSEFLAEMGIFSWRESDLRLEYFPKHGRNRTKKRNKIKEHIYVIINRCFGRNVHDFLNKSMPKVFLESEAREKVIQYLNVCVQMYADKIVRDAVKSELREEIKGMYYMASNSSNTKDRDIERVIQSMENDIAKYRKSNNGFRV